MKENQEIAFAQILEEVKKLAKEQGNCISEEQVKEAFKEISLEENQLALVFDYLKKHKIPYTVGKIWTTDAIYRETPEAIEERKKQGCIAVEMECSASLAVARFRNIPIIQFFYGADNLDCDQWEIRDLTDYGLSLSDKYMTIALECGIAF